MANQLYRGSDPLATTCPNVVDNLTSTSSTDALSAKQGKVLNDKLSPLTGMAVDNARLLNLNVDIATLFARGIRVYEALYPSSASNVPSGGGAGYSLTLIWDSNSYATQVAFTQDTLGIYMRKYANGTWTAWTKMSAN